MPITNDMIAQIIQQGACDEMIAIDVKKILLWMEVEGIELTVVWLIA